MAARKFAMDFGHRFVVTSFDVDGVVLARSEAETWKALAMGASMNPECVTIQVLDRVKQTNRRSERNNMKGAVQK